MVLYNVAINTPGSVPGHNHVNKIYKTKRDNYNGSVRVQDIPSQEMQKK